MTEAAHKFAAWFSEQRSLPYRMRKSVVKRLYPDLLKDYDFETDFFGMTYRGNAGNYIDRMIFFCGAYEKYMLYFLRDYVDKVSNDNLIFWDIGANVGNHSLFMSQLVKEVHAFEPFERVRNHMEEMIALNNIHNIKVHDVGLSNKKDNIPFFAPREDSLGNGSFVDGCNEGNSFLMELAVTTGDIVSKTDGIDHVDIVKMDVEGFERNVLEGMRETLTTSRPLVILEMSPATRETFKNYEGMQQCFPENYAFFCFAKASRDGGAYRIAPLDFNQHYRRRDVIACPNEKKEYLH